MKTDHELWTAVFSALRVAMLGFVKPKLRAVIVSCSDQKIVSRFVYDDSMDTDDVEERVLWRLNCSHASGLTIPCGALQRALQRIRKLISGRANSLHFVALSLPAHGGRIDAEGRNSPIHDGSLRPGLLKVAGCDLRSNPHRRAAIGALKRTSVGVRIPQHFN